MAAPVPCAIFVDDGGDDCQASTTHGIPCAQAYDHRHRFGLTADLVVLDFRGANGSIRDFFAAVELTCRQEGVPFEFEADEVEYLMEESDDPDDSVNGAKGGNMIASSVEETAPSRETAASGARC